MTGERFVGNTVPKVDVDTAKRIYHCISDATQQELCHSIHSPNLGGLGVAIAQVAFAGGYGLDIDLRKIPSSGLKRDDLLLFSQSNSRFIVTIPPIKQETFEKIMDGCTYAKIGIVTEEMKLRVKGLGGEYIIDSDLELLKNTWKNSR
jgi:phosphoribosylformylglycinamidine synthase